MNNHIIQTTNTPDCTCTPKSQHKSLTETHLNCSLTPNFNTWKTLNNINTNLTPTFHKKHHPPTSLIHYHKCNQHLNDNIHFPTSKPTQLSNIPTIISILQHNQPTQVHSNKQTSNTHKLKHQTHKQHNQTTGSSWVTN